METETLAGTHSNQQNQKVYGPKGYLPQHPQALCLLQAYRPRCGAATHTSHLNIRVAECNPAYIDNCRICKREIRKTLYISDSLVSTKNRSNNSGGRYSSLSNPPLWLLKNITSKETIILIPITFFDKQVPLAKDPKEILLFRPFWNLFATYFATHKTSRASNTETTYRTENDPSARCYTESLFWHQ